MLGIVDLLRELSHPDKPVCIELLLAANFTERTVFRFIFFTFFPCFPVDITFYRCSNCRGNVYSMKNKYIMKYQVSQTDIRLRYCIPDFINQFDDFS